MFIFTLSNSFENNNDEWWISLTTVVKRTGKFVPHKEVRVQEALKSDMSWIKVVVCRLVGNY